MHQVHGLASEDHGRIDIIGLCRAGVARPLVWKRSLELRFSPVPLSREIVLQRPSRVDRRPVDPPRDVEDPRANRVVAPGGENPRLRRRRCQSLVRGEKASTDENTIRAEHQGGCETAAIRDPAGSHDHRLFVALVDGVDHGRHEGER